MPFNASGVFSRLYSWVTDRDNGVRILAQRMDEEFNGLVSAINQITSGAIAFRGPLRNVNGTRNAPAYGFRDDPNTGMYRYAEDVLGLTGGDGDFRVGPTTLTYNDGKVYHAGDRPTAAEVGALPAGGTAANSTLFAGQALAAFPRLAQSNVFTNSNTFVGLTYFDRESEVKARLAGSQRALIDAYGTDGVRTGILLFDDDADLFRIWLDPSGELPRASLDLSRDGSLRVNGQKVYHAGDRPTPSDLGAVSLTTVQDLSGPGAMAFLRIDRAATVGFNYPGSALTVAGVTSTGSLHVGAATMSGTWRALGACPANGATLFVRIL